MTGATYREAAVSIFEFGWNQGSFARVRGMLAATFRLHVHGSSRDTDPAEFEAIVGAWRAAFPDLRFEIHHVIAEGELVAVRATLMGTNLGEWRGRPPTGREIAVDHAFFLRFADGVVVEVWEVLDSAELARQVAV